MPNTANFILFPTRRASTACQVNVGNFHINMEILALLVMRSHLVTLALPSCKRVNLFEMLNSNIARRILSSRARPPCIAHINSPKSLHLCLMCRYCPRTDKRTIISCDNGYYSVANSSKCTRCPLGYKCPHKNHDYQ